jgi:hypothetical protein
VGEGQDTTGHPSTARVSVQEASELFDTTVDAIRKRVQRGTIPYEKASDGRVWILLDPDRTRHAGDQDSTGHRQDSESGALTSELRDRLRYVEGQLEAERQAHAEARRLLVAALERIPPQLEAPPEARGAPETGAEASEGAEPRPATGGAQESAHRPWWRRMFGG